jgi:phospholipase/carboxylesterase
VSSLHHLSQKPRRPSEGKPPLLLLLHGVRSNEHDLMGLAPELDPRFHIVSLRAPLTFGPGMFGWFPIEFLPGGGFKIDPEVADRSRRQVISFIDEATAEYGTDPDRVYLMGFSQGCIMSLASALTEPEKVAGVVGMSGRLLPEVEPKIAEPDRLKGLPMIVVHGEYDEVIPLSYGRVIRDKLSALPLDLTYREYPMAHQVSQRSLNDITEWLTARLDGPRRTEK